MDELLVRLEVRALAVGITAADEALGHELAHALKRERQRGRLSLQCRSGEFLPTEDWTPFGNLEPKKSDACGALTHAERAGLQ